jgi:hypothetical protein
MYDKNDGILTRIQAGVDNLQVSVTLLKIIHLFLIDVSECEHDHLSFLQWYVQTEDTTQLILVPVIFSSRIKYRVNGNDPSSFNSVLKKGGGDIYCQEENFKVSHRCK